MKNLNVIIILLCAFISYADSKSNKFAWLNNRYLYLNGPKQNGMAGVGFTLPADENVLFLNPAGLGIPHKRVRSFTFSYGNTYEPHGDWSYLIRDHFLTASLQPFKDHTGGFSFLADFYILTQDTVITQTLYDPNTGLIVNLSDTLSSDQLNVSSIIGYGRDLSFINLKNHAIGISALLNNHVFSNFGNPASTGSLHLNIGYTGSFFKFSRVGFVLINIPVLKSFNRDIKIITPFAIVSSFGLNPILAKHYNIDVLKLFTELSYKLAIERHENPDSSIDTLDIENMVKTHFISGGFEFGINEILFLRNGYRGILNNDFDLNKVEIATGIGINREHFEVNFFFSVLFYRYHDISIRPSKRFGISINFFNSSKAKKD